MTQETELARQLHNLKMLVKTANDPKLLWEEMQILGKKAFQLQEKMEKNLNELESVATEVTTVQMLSDTREMMWDLMQQLAIKELELKNKPHPHTRGEGCCCAHQHCSCHSQETHHEHKHCCQGKKKCQKK